MRARWHWLGLVGSLLMGSLTLDADAAPAWQAVVGQAGAIQLSVGGKGLGNLEPGLFEGEWRGAGLNTAKPGEMADGLRRGQIRTPGGAAVACELRAEPVEEGLHLSYRLTPQADVRLNSLHVSLGLPAGLLAGGRFAADGQEKPFPKDRDQTHLYSAPTSALELVTLSGACLRFRFDQPAPVLVQDDRQWGPTFSVRIGPQATPAAEWPAGKALEIAFSLTVEGGMAVEYDEPVTIQPGPEWLPLDVSLDVEPGSALDFSGLVPWHQPAGKLGRVVAAPNGRMAFAARPGEPVRFYGVNFCFSAHYLTHEQADQLAERLYRLGYNAVRVHHYESLLVDRSGGTSTSLKPEALEQLDYLMAAFKKRGIYVTTDLFVSRPVFAREVWEGAPGDVGMDEFKMAARVNDRAFANFKTFSVALLSHVNPHTGVRWADDPAIAWLSLINEGNPGNFLGRLQGKLAEDWAGAWNRWLAERYPARDALEKALGKVEAGQDPKAGSVPMPGRLDDSPQGIQLSLFLADVERSFYERTRKFLRDEVKCQALLTDMNGWTNPIQNQMVRGDMDYVDDHFYVDHPQFIEKPWSLPSRCPNTSPVAGGGSGGRGCAFVRLLDRPFTCSEFNYSGPGRFRGVGGILTGALGSVQDWSVIWRFAYSHNRDNLFRPSGAGYFDVATDPLSQASERASLCLFRRGDMKPAPHSVGIVLTPDEVLKAPKSARGVTPGWTDLALVTRVGVVIADSAAKATGADLLLPLDGRASGKNVLAVDPYAPDAGEKTLAEMRARGWLGADNPTDPAAPRFRSETGELTVDGPEDVLTLDTARTAGGYAPAGKKVVTGAATIAVEDTGATVWVSSLDGSPLRQSRRMLVTHLTDLQNTGARYGEKARQVLLAWGGLPHLVRTGRATVTLRVANPAKARVWGLATSGKRLGEVKAQAGNGTLTIPLDVNDGGKARMLYEVEMAP